MRAVQRSHRSQLPRERFKHKANPYGEERAQTYADNIWRLADSMATERSRSETGRVARTCLYAWAMFVGTGAVLGLAMFGASILFVVRVTELIQIQTARAVKRRLRWRPLRPRRAPEPTDSAPAAAEAASLR